MTHRRFDEVRVQEGNPCLIHVQRPLNPGARTHASQLLAGIHSRDMAVRSSEALIRANKAPRGPHKGEAGLPQRSPPQQGAEEAEAGPEPGASQPVPIPHGG
jgi:hypothetical protein